MIRLKSLLNEQVTTQTSFVDANSIYEILNNFNKEEMKPFFDMLQSVMSKDPQKASKYDMISRRFSHDWAKFYSQVLELFSDKA